MILKATATTILILSLFSSPLHAQKLLGPIDYILKFEKEIESGDLFHVSSVLQRCAAIFGAYAKYLPSDMQDYKKKYFDLMVNTSADAVMMLNKKNQNSSEGNQNQVFRAIDKMIPVFYDNIENDQLATGSIFEGKTGVDMNVCMKNFAKK